VIKWLIRPEIEINYSSAAIAGGIELEFVDYLIMSDLRVLQLREV
jgi:hypothetical protein